MRVGTLTSAELGNEHLRKDGCGWRQWAVLRDGAVPGRRVRIAVLIQRYALSERIWHLRWEHYGARHPYGPGQMEEGFGEPILCCFKRGLRQALETLDATKRRCPYYASGECFLCVDVFGKSERRVGA